jgi:hypothetical protein
LVIGLDNIPLPTNRHGNVRNWSAGSAERLKCLGLTFCCRRHALNLFRKLYDSGRTIHHQSTLSIVNTKRQSPPNAFYFLFQAQMHSISSSRQQMQNIQAFRQVSTEVPFSHFPHSVRPKTAAPRLLGRIFVYASSPPPLRGRRRHCS